MVVTTAWLLGVSVAINLAMFLVAFRYRSDKLTDASYAATFITLALLAYASASKDTYRGIATALVCTWALRIGSFLLYRVIRAGKDRRFDGVREHFWQFGKFWLGQAVTVWVLLLPIMLLQPRASLRHPLVFIGGLVWLAGLLLETVADMQKYRFTHDPSYTGQWMSSGVWRYSRHPNYFGEMLVWLGIYLYALPGLSAIGSLVAVASPLGITALLLFVSGVPPLEKAADQRWGDQPAYRHYRQRTSLIVPLPPKNREQLNQP